MQWQIVFSTGLLILEPTPITLCDVPFVVRTGFNASGFDLGDIGSTAAQRVYGVQTGLLSYPSDTAANLVVQRIDPPSGLPLSTYTAEVQGFSTDLECEILHLGNATTTSLPWFSILAPYFVVNITTDSCHVVNAIVGQGVDHGYYRDNNVTLNYQGRFQTLLAILAAIVLFHTHLMVTAPWTIASCCQWLLCNGLLINPSLSPPPSGLNN